MKTLDSLYLSKEEPVRGCLLALRRLILEQDEHVTEVLKYGMPCFCYKKKMVCYLWTDKRTGEPYILFVEVKHLDHPKLEQGDRRRMKVLRVSSARDLHTREIKQVLKCALDLHRAAIAIKRK